jgi:hypothetical protein
MGIRRLYECDICRTTKIEPYGWKVITGEKDEDGQEKPFVICDDCKKEIQRLRTSAKMESIAETSLNEPTGGVGCLKF